MPSNLTDNYVANTYKGVLHVNGEELPADVRVQVYDGAGNETAIKLGVGGIDCLSLSAHGLTANDFKYPDIPGNRFDVLCQATSEAEGKVNSLELKNIEDIFCSTNAGPTYTRETESAVPVVQTQCGIVVGIKDVEITNITTAAGGIDLTQTGNFSITTANVDGGIIKGLTLTQISQPVNPNLLINAQGIVNQRRIFSGNPLNQLWNPRNYFIDRWKSIGGTAITWAYNNNSNIATFTAPIAGISQKIERINIIPGRYVLSWIGSATATIRENGVEKQGSTTSSNNVNTRIVDLGGGGDVEIIFRNGTVSLPKLERGSIRTEFDYRDFGSELQLCQRYFSKTYPYTTPPQTANRSGAIQHHGTEPINPAAHNLQWRYPVEMTSSATAYAFDPTGSQNPNRFAIIGQLDNDREVDFRSHTCDVRYNTSGVTAIIRTSGADNLYPNGMRIAVVHIAVDAEL